MATMKIATFKNMFKEVIVARMPALSCFFANLEACFKLEEEEFPA